MKSTSYLSSARVYSVLMLLSVYLGFNLATSYARRINLLHEARQAFAVLYLANEDTNPFRQVAGIGSVNIRLIEVDDRSDWFVETRKKHVWLLTVVRSTGRQWESVVDKAQIETEPVVPSATPVSTTEEAAHTANAALSVARSTPDKASANITRIALELGLKDSDQKHYSLILRDIEQEIVDREVTVPGIDLAFRSDLAPWIISILVIGFLLLIRNCVNTVLLDKELALGEPWIVVDAGTGLEKCVATGWLIAIWIAPWIATGCLLVVLSGGGVADGGIASTTRTTVASIIVMVLVVIGGWASLTVTASLLQLRRQRRELLRQSLVKPPSSFGFE